MFSLCVRPLGDLGDPVVNKIGFVLALSGERDNQENKTITRNAGEEAKEGVRDRSWVREWGKPISQGP